MADPYRDETAHLRARVAALEEDLADARRDRDARKRPKKPRRKKATPTAVVPRTKATPQTSATRWLLGAPTAIETEVTVDGRVDPAAHDALRRRLERASPRAGQASVVGDRFGFVTSDRNGQHLFEVEVAAQSRTTRLRVFRRLGPALALRMLVGVGVVGMQAVVAIATLTTLSTPIKLLASVFLVFSTWIVSRALNVGYAQRRVREQETLVKALAADCAPFLGATGTKRDAEDERSAPRSTSIASDAVAEAEREAEEERDAEDESVDPRRAAER